MSLHHILNSVTQDIFLTNLSRVSESLYHDTGVETDVLTIISPIFHGLENFVKEAVESIGEKKPHLAVILDTGGGVVEVVERMVTIIRNHYEHITFIVQDRAMSAGTIFVMSGDRILMNYFSVLGPIDPQLEKDGKMIPVLAYLDQFEKLKEASQKGTLTTAEMVLLQKLDLAELQWFEQAKELSIDLLKKWLSTYKFKNWVQHKSTGLTVTIEQKEQRAVEVATALCNNRQWHSHGRGLSKEVLTQDLKLLIDDIDAIANLGDNLASYISYVRDYMVRENKNLFIHSRGYML
ncbi:TPA: serine dehydrogenasease [Acinetobacter baumannii]|uniref:SDH family Clp fold serine proteinase n=1 Tax=Acinetobacter baumannii TaxID=470 RepID=UPI001900AFA7|nr:hypothetical protein [Acinetobacter baumannii]MBJ9481341.1 hypothetical protein [Acinetobacter baumannii]MBJ9910217.1 hypothetical protein [Acinetobacter baumannii]MBJ9944704.1 hypothetical protein [Acinetobacter baumannii]MCO9026357.1 hypothetical protein [Acinetobacter baumannii]HAV4193810.1 serine dehydrogenasease [Acinetobacter baumannii]